MSKRFYQLNYIQVTVWWYKRSCTLSEATAFQLTRHRHKYSILVWRSFSNQFRSTLKVTFHTISSLCHVNATAFHDFSLIPFLTRFREAPYTETFSCFCIVSSNELVVFDSLENSKQYKNAGKRFRVYGARVIII